MTAIPTLYGIPDELRPFVDAGFLEILSEHPADGVIRFAIPSLREQDGDGNTLSYSLKWSRTPFKTARDYRANFELVIRHEEADWDSVELLETTDALIAWLTGGTRCVRRKKAGTPLPAPEELADAFCTILNKWLPPETIAEINRRNALPKYRGCCASHDFCDPNQAMIDAMWSFGIPFGQEDDVIRMINEAWSISKERGFVTGNPVGTAG